MIWMECAFVTGSLKDTVLDAQSRWLKLHLVDWWNCVHLLVLFLIGFLQSLQFFKLLMRFFEAGIQVDYFGTPGRTIQSLSFVILSKVIIRFKRKVEGQLDCLRGVWLFRMLIIRCFEHIWVWTSRIIQYGSLLIAILLSIRIVFVHIYLALEDSFEIWLALAYHIYSSVHCIELISDQLGVNLLG